MSAKAMRMSAVAAGPVVVLPLFFAVSGCVDTSPDRVKLTAALTDVNLAVTQSSLVTSLSGSFALHLNLGDLAQEKATVTDPPTFQLVTAANRSTIGGLDALVQGATFPVTVDPGKSVVLSYQLNDQQSLPSAAMTAACAGDVEVTAALKDSSNGDQLLTVDSSPTKPSGCP